MSKLIERQVFVTWYTPEEKLPEESELKVVTFSGRKGNITYEHTFGIGSWFDDGCGWMIEGVNDDADSCDLKMTVHAWCDLVPYGWREV